MRQATGSNTPQSGNKVSIQLSLDGHSFSVPALSELPAGEASVKVELLLPRTMLVPGELFDAERGAEMLAANGMPPTAEECVVASDPEAETVAVTAIDREALRQVEEKLGDRARFTTPLLHTPANAAKTVWMSRRAGLLYIKVYDNGELQLAEVIPAATDTDVAYFFDRLDGCFPLKEYELRIAGDNPKAALMTRGISEMGRLGELLGGQARTFSGLSGIGDLIVTCTSGHSRNRHVGEELGRGRKLPEILRSMGMVVAEGVTTARGAYALARRVGAETPIIDEIYAILYQDRDVPAAIRNLMCRSAKPEV